MTSMSCSMPYGIGARGRLRVVATTSLLAAGCVQGLIVPCVCFGALKGLAASSSVAESESFFRLLQPRGGGGRKKILIPGGIFFFGGDPPLGVGGTKKSGSYGKNFFFPCRTYHTEGAQHFMHISRSGDDMCRL